VAKAAKTLSATTHANGDSKKSAISSSLCAFRLTSEYLVNAKELQIKMAKVPNRRRRTITPGAKVYPPIAKVRYSHAWRRFDLPATTP